MYWCISDDQCMNTFRSHIHWYNFIFFTFSFRFKHSYQNLVFVGRFDCLLCGFSSRIFSVCFMVIPILLMGMQVSHISCIFQFQTCPICISCHFYHFMALSASYFPIMCGKWKSILWELCCGTINCYLNIFFFHLIH